MKNNRDRLKLLFIGLWMAFTMALAGWWLVFGLRQLDETNRPQTVEMPQRHRMLLWEGGVLLASLLGGGVALMSYAWRERRRHQQIEEFFAAFTHDAKTALASLRLQAECLREDWGEDKPNPLLERLLKDTLRLQLQLENSLFLVNLRTGQFFLEPVRVGALVAALRHHWPDLDIVQEGDAVLHADTRALESVFTNLVQNSVTHGQATRIVFHVTTRDGVRLRVADNGRGFSGDYGPLGALFVRPTRGSGSGVGLYIACQLVKRLHGKLSFAPGTDGGFTAQLHFPRASGNSGQLVVAGGQSAVVSGQ